MTTTITTTDLDKFKPRLLDPVEYDAMRTALDALRKEAEKTGPEKLQEIVGTVKASEGVPLSNHAPPPPIYRSYADHWACRDCNNRGDKWYMQDHCCSRSKVPKNDWLRKIKGHRKAKIG
jgi:hypothetical protein